MTNFEYIKQMSAEEFAHKVINSCDNYTCEVCMFKDYVWGSSMKTCVRNCVILDDPNDEIAINWLNKEYESEEQ